MGEGRHTDRILIGELEEKKPLGKLRVKLDDNIKMDLKEIGWHGVNWICLGQDSGQWRVLVYRVMPVRVL
jgi:hypothetical protein